MPPVGFEPTISAGERPQTYALDHAATGTDKYIIYIYICMYVCVCVYMYVCVCIYIHTHTHICVCVCVCVRVCVSFNWEIISLGSAIILCVLLCR